MPTKTGRVKILHVTPDHLRPEVDKLKEEVSTLNRLKGAERAIKTLEKRRIDLKDENHAATADLLIARADAKAIVAQAKEQAAKEAEDLCHIALRQKEAIREESTKATEQIARRREEIKKEEEALEEHRAEVSAFEQEMDERNRILSEKEERCATERVGLNEQIQELGEREMVHTERIGQAEKRENELTLGIKDLATREKQLESSVRKFGEARTKLATDMEAAQGMAQDAQRRKQEADREWGRIHTARAEVQRVIDATNLSKETLSTKTRELSAERRRLGEEDRRIQRDIGQLERMRLARVNEERRLIKLRKEIQENL